MSLTVPQGLRVANNSPADDRTVFQTLALAKSSLNTARRHRGLKVFILDELCEYWFRDGITNADLIPYRPGAALYTVSSLSERDSIPESLRFEGMEVNVTVGGNITKYFLIGGLTNEYWQNDSASIMTWTVVNG